MMKEKRLVYDIDYPQLRDMFISWGEPAYRTDQFWQGLYSHLWNVSGQFTTLPVSLRNKIDENISFRHLHPVTTMKSSDAETVKTLFRLPDRNAVEAVIMKYHKRRTLCISTQAGCAMGCVFCATGQMGLRRNLSSGEIVEQVMYYARHLSENDERVTNIVFMGMGEPFHNYDATMGAIDLLNRHNGFNFGARRITISTIGIVPAIQRFTEEKRQVNLAISLHAIDDDMRTNLLPINRRYPVDLLLDTCKDYVRFTRRRISIEWALIKGVNDSVNHAKELVRKLKMFKINGAMLCHVNIIPLNPTTGYVGVRTTRKQALLFSEELSGGGIPCSIRLRRGIDIQAGCGQLAIKV
jgi:23S rRNA (adenine2503-C2)-methyltransferase